MDTATLEKLGLNKNEAKVYSTLIKLGPSPAGILIKETEFHRNIIYDNLDKLADKGLISFISEGKKKIFQPNSPETIMQMLEKEQESLDEKKKLGEILKKDIEKLIHKDKNKQEASIFRGVKGLKFILNDTLKEGRDYLVFGAPKASIDIMGDVFWQNYNLKRKEEGINVKMIFNEEIREWSKKISDKKTIIRFLPKQFDVLSETMVYGDKVAIIVWTDKPIATLIKDKNLAESYKNYFNLLWEQSKK